MENNLYYTPELNEFHIGFDYEVNYGDKWVSETQFEGFLHNKKLENIRVKYLDQSDIESLGWELNHTKNSPFTGKDLNTYQLTKEYGFNTGTTYTLEQLDNNFYLIKSETYSSYGSEVYRMSFTIFNKSELIKLMQQLNIK